MSTATKWIHEKVSRNVMVMRWNGTGMTDIPTKVLLVGDAHWDNPKCDHELLKFHLDQALEIDAPILIGGDFFCAMQGKYDKRSNKNDIRPEHQSGTYLDKLVSTAADWLEPYKKNIYLICRGNHETSILAHHETDLTDRLVQLLKDRGGICESGGYAGWVKFLITRGLRSEAPRSAAKFNMHYHHGFGGGGPVTMGKIDFNRYAIQVQYDILWAQHVHNTEIFDTRLAVLNDSHNVEQRARWHIRTPTYKEEYQDGFGGFHVEKGRGPRPLGGVWIEFYRLRGMRDKYAVLPSRTKD
jgi:hypothetical protein